MLQRPAPVSTAPLFAGLHRHLMELLRELEPADWDRPTVAGAWRVRDVAAHLLDGQIRRLSFQRDGHPLPDAAPDGDAGSGRETEGGLVAFLDRLNAAWVTAMERVSPRVLVELLAVVGPELAAFMEEVDPEGPAFFPVGWAGEDVSPAWMDVGRDYTELWHHQAQIRDAVGAAGLLERRWLHPVLALGARALPPALENLTRPAGATLVFHVSGAAGGSWTVRREGDGWALLEGAPDVPDARLSFPPDAAWRLLFNALDPEEARAAGSLEGDGELVRAALAARSVMV